MTKNNNTNNLANSTNDAPSLDKFNASSSYYLNLVILLYYTNYKNNSK